MKTRILKISELSFDKDFYPRAKIDWLTALRYADSMKAGAIFPPISIGNFEQRLFVIDGLHRVEAKKLLKEEYVEGVVRDFKSKNDMFIEAVKLNVTHGKPLSVQEKVRIIDKLKNMEFTLEQISKVMLVPIDTVKRFEIRTIIGPNGQPIYLKAPVAKANVDETKKANVSQAIIQSRNYQILVQELLELLEKDIIPSEDKTTWEMLIHLYALLGQKLKLVEPVEAR